MCIHKQFLILFIFTHFPSITASFSAHVCLSFLQLLSWVECCVCYTEGGDWLNSRTERQSPRSCFCWQRQLPKGIKLLLFQETCTSESQPLAWPCSTWSSTHGHRSHGHSASLLSIAATIGRRKNVLLLVWPHCVTFPGILAFPRIRSLGKSKPCRLVLTHCHHFWTQRPSEDDRPVCWCCWPQGTVGLWAQFPWAAHILAWVTCVFVNPSSETIVRMQPELFTTACQKTHK